jgi:hypothetical protein
MHAQSSNSGSWNFYDQWHVDEETQKNELDMREVLKVTKQARPSSAPTISVFQRKRTGS